MSRLATGLDRLLVLLVGLVLIVVGAGAILWQLATFSQAPKTLTAPGLVHATTQSWWPWAVGIGGAVLILLSLRWLGAHVPGRKVHDFKLAGSDATGKLTVDLSALAAAAPRRWLRPPVFARPRVRPSPTAAAAPWNSSPQWSPPPTSPR